MRPASIVFALVLVGCASLTAQTPNSSAPAILVEPPAADACPVQLSVGRVPQGAVVWTSSESEWFMAHRNLSLDELKRAMQAEPGFHDLSPQMQQSKLDLLAQMYNRQNGQGLEIAFKTGKTILSADIVVHGYPPLAHAIPATPHAPAEVTETFHLAADGLGKPLLHSSVWPRQMLTINWIELTHLQYSDGTAWQSSAAATCRAAPSLFVLVDAGK